LGLELGHIAGVYYRISCYYYTDQLYWGGLVL